MYFRNNNLPPPSSEPLAPAKLRRPFLPPVGVLARNRRRIVPSLSRGILLETPSADSVAPNEGQIPWQARWRKIARSAYSKFRFPFGLVRFLGGKVGQRNGIKRERAGCWQTGRKWPGIRKWQSSGGEERRGSWVGCTRPLQCCATNETSLKGTG